jgi:predicted phosphoribosyltransferase
MASHDLPELRDRTQVFRDRTHAGEVLAGMLEGWRAGDACVLAIPAGGVPVAAALCRVLALPLGLASGFTMRVAVDALRKLAPRRLGIAAPTGSPRALGMLEDVVEELYCANVRGGLRFAVAEAYERWSDVAEREVIAILARGVPG